ncbi:MAG: type III pantothenate kinase [Cycloclasticus sp.]
MRQLFIDRGNTALKWQVVDSGDLLKQGRALNHIGLDVVFAALEGHSFSTIHVSSVGADDFNVQLTTWAEKNKRPCPTFIASSNEACGVTNGYKESSQLGVDRWLALIAAHHKYSGMLCIVDSGTALTMDVVTENGRHLGGYIVPGSELMKTSLLANTQKVNVQDSAPRGLFGTNTTQAVLFGINQMLQAFVSKKVLDIEAEYQLKVSTILTGGHAQALADSLSMPVYVEEDLVIQGLRLLAEQAE